MTELENVPAAHAVHGAVVVTDAPAGHGGPVLSTQVSVSPEAPPVRKALPHTQMLGMPWAEPAAEVELAGHAEHELFDEL